MADEKDELTDFQRVLSDYASLFHNTGAGQRILADLKKVLDQPSYKPGRSHDEVLWREGRRSVYLDIVAAVGEGIAVIESMGSEQQTHAEGADGDPLDL